MHAETVVDIARTLTAEQGDARRGAVVRAGDARHRSRVTSATWRADAVGAPRRGRRRAGRGAGSLLDATPPLAELPDSVRSGSRRLASAPPRRAPVGALADALERSARAASALERRLSVLADASRGALRRDGVRLPLRPGAAAPLDRLPRRRRHASIPAATTCSPPRRGSRASSPSPRATCPCSTGSGSAVPLTPVGRGSALVSWSGSMFEYLMPSLVMRAPAGQPARADQPARRAPADRSTARERGVPWGVSESAYNARDLELTYQYSNFGVPGLGLKRGLGEDVVVAPYATALAAMVDPAAAVRELRAPRRRSARAGRYGFYEALDYTPARLPEGEPVAIVRAYMAHHQGMTLVALANALLDGVMRAPLPRRAARPGDRAAAPGAHAARRRRGASARRGGEGRSRRARRSCRRCCAASDSPHDRDAAHASALERPLRRDGDGRRLRLQPLARPRRHALARGRRPATPGARYLFLRDVRQRRGLVGGLPADAASSPTATRSRSRGPGRDSSAATARSRRRSRSPSRPRTTPRCAASSITNLGDAHARDRGDLLCRGRAGARRPPTRRIRRSRSSSCRPSSSPASARCWRRGAALARRAAGLGGAPRGRRGRDRRARVQYETDRARFLGRGRSDPRRRCRWSTAGRSPNTVGHGARSDLQPAPPRAAGAGRDGARRVLDAGRAVARATRSISPTSTATRRPSSARSTLAWTQAQVQLHHLGIEPRRGAALPAPRRPRALLRSDAARRRRTCSSARDGGPPALWAHGISGDLPIVLVRIDEAEDLEHRPAAAAGPRVLADEAARGRSRDPERAAVVLRAGPAGARSRRWCAPSRAPRRPTASRRAAASSCCAPTSIPAETRDAAAGGGARGPAQSPRQPRGAGAIACEQAPPAAAPPAAPRAARRERAGRLAAAEADARVLQRPRRLRRRMDAST